MNAIRAILLLPCATLCAALGSAKLVVQQSPTGKQKAAAATTGELNGFVFLITRSGDIKPARLASVTILSVSGGRSASKDDKSRSAGETYMDYLESEFQKQSDAIRQQMETKNFKSEEEQCVTDLEWRTVVLKSTVDWATVNKKTSEILTADADEEGHFRVLRVPAGTYIVVVVGQAGVNQAFWDQLNVQVTAGHATSLKMTTPRTACVRP